MPVILLLVVIGTAMLVLLLIIFELESEVSRLQSLAEFATGIIDTLLSQIRELSSKVVESWKPSSDNMKNRKKMSEFVAIRKGG